jgi:hypothetical protein
LKLNRPFNYDLVGLNPTGFTRIGLNRIGLNGIKTGCLLQGGPSFLLQQSILPFSTLQKNDILAIVVGASFASGLNVYATLATLGVLSHLNLFQLPPALHLIQSWTVIRASLALFLLELFADKIPVFDLLWNALHTFIRVPIAALLRSNTAHVARDTTCRSAAWWNHCIGIA